MAKKVKLSKEKIVSFLTDHGYTLTAVYKHNESNVCLFFEVKTPILHRTFFLRIPDKYEVVDKSDTATARTLTDTNEQSRKQLDRLMEIKGPLLDCDMVCVSSDFFYFYPHDDELKTYSLKGNNIPTSLDNMEDDDVDIVKKLVDDTNTIIQRIDPKEKVDSIAQSKKKKKNKNRKYITELVFEEDDDSIKMTPGMSDDDKKFPLDNSVPINVDEQNIIFGIVYFSVDLHLFFKKVSELEDEIIVACDAMDDNEADSRVTKLAKITDMATQLVTQAKKRLDDIQEEDRKMRNQLQQLTRVLVKSDEMIQKLQNDPKSVATATELENVKQKTKNTINEINVERLQKKDVANDLIINYHTTLSELLEL